MNQTKYIIGLLVTVLVLLFAWNIVTLSPRYEPEALSKTEPEKHKRYIYFENTQEDGTIVKEWSYPDANEHYIEVIPSGDK